MWFSVTSVKGLLGAIYKLVFLECSYHPVIWGSDKNSQRPYLETGFPNFTIILKMYIMLSGIGYG